MPPLTSIFAKLQRGYCFSSGIYREITPHICHTYCGNMSASNSTGLQELKKIADRYNDISSNFEMTEKNGKPDQYYDNENKTLDEEKNNKDTQ